MPLLIATSAPALSFFISHKILLKKLLDYGFRGTLISILQNILTNRTQQVSLCSSLSDKVFLKAGVPQGLVLSPLIFNIYVSDLGKTYQDVISISTLTILS